MKTITNANIVELHYEEELHNLDMYDTVDSGIKTYYNEYPNFNNIEEMIEFIADFYKYTGKPYELDIDLTDNREIKKALMQSFENNDILKHVLEEFSEEYLWEDESYASFSDILEDNLEYELFEEIIEWIDIDTLYDNLMELTEFRIQYMYGNSQGDWGYALVVNDLDEEYVESLWSGNNWYWVEVNHSDGSYDSLGALYIRNKEDLDEALADHFGVYNYYLINNEIANYYIFDECKKVKEVIVETEYRLV